MFHAMQSVVLKEDVLEEGTGEKLLSEGQAGYVVGDRSVVVNGVAEGEVDVKMDVDGDVYTLQVNDIRAL